MRTAAILGRRPTEAANALRATAADVNNRRPPPQPLGPPAPMGAVVVLGRRRPPLLPPPPFEGPPSPTHSRYPPSSRPPLAVTNPDGQRTSPAASGHHRRASASHLPVADVLAAAQTPVSFGGGRAGSRGRGRDTVDNCWKR
ncbi:Os06g0286801 [Oryza sativa Japonica Group]|nr:Os06g0286801 [Oryza sativa Japonica Group]